MTKGLSVVKALAICGSVWLWPAAGRANVLFYVNAHADDVELFMGASLAHDIVDQPDANAVVVITTTAGDAGLGTGTGNGLAPLYLARERGHANALQFLEGLTQTPTGARYVGQMVKVGSKSVYRAKMVGHNITWYNLRLPDGGVDGSGFAGTGYQSLRRLLEGKISQISTVDTGQAYTRADLVVLFRNLIKLHVGAQPTVVWAHMVDQNPDSNPGDHADHQATATLFMQALSLPTFQCVNKAFYTTYVNQNKAVNMTPAEQLMHPAMWGALNVGLSIGLQGNSWNDAHLAWINKEYAYTVVSATSPCQF